MTASRISPPLGEEGNITSQSWVKKKKGEAEWTHCTSMASAGGYEQLGEPAGDGVYQALNVFVLDWSGLVVRSGGFTER